MTSSVSLIVSTPKPAACCASWLDDLCSNELFASTAGNVGTTLCDHPLQLLLLPGCWSSSFSSSLIEPYLLSSPLTFHYDQNRPYYKDIQCTLGKCCSKYHNNFSCICFSQQLVAILFCNLLSQSPASSHGSLPICSFWQSSHLFPLPGQVQ